MERHDVFGDRQLVDLVEADAASGERTGQRPGVTRDDGVAAPHAHPRDVHGLGVGGEDRADRAGVLGIQRRRERIDDIPGLGERRHQ